MSVNPIIPCLSKERQMVIPGVQGRYQEAPVPQDIAVEITRRCFQNCKLCYGNFGQGEEMPWERVRAVMKAFDEANITTIHLTGGEPLWHSQIEMILRHFGENGYKIEMDTNGVLINRDMADILASFGVEVMVGLDTLRPDVYRWYRGTDSLTAVLSGLDFMQERGMVPGIQAVMADFSGLEERKYDPVKNILDLIRHVTERGLPIYLLQFRPRGRALDAQGVIDLSAEQKQQLRVMVAGLPLPQRELVAGDLRYSLEGTSDYYGCLGGILWANMTVEGDVYLCNWMRDQIFGNVFRGRLAEILREMRRFRLDGLENLNCDQRVCDFSGKGVCFGPCLVSKAHLEMVKRRQVV